VSVCVRVHAQRRAGVAGGGGHAWWVAEKSRAVAIQTCERSLT
jgi:hypothetical protein